MYLTHAIHKVTTRPSTRRRWFRRKEAKEEEKKTKSKKSDGHKTDTIINTIYKKETKVAENRTKAVDVDIKNRNGSSNNIN